MTERPRASNPHGALLTIDLGALAANWRMLRERAAPAECAGVVKANAYGIGIEEAVPALREAGCRTFFVAHLGEGARVRSVAPDATIYVLNGLPADTAARYLDHDLRPVLGSFEELAEWAEASAAAGRRLPAALHVDTGMNRLGFMPREVQALAADPRLAAIEPALLMSHLVAAEDPGDDTTARQIAEFARLRGLFPDLPASLSNSSGLFRSEMPALDLVRPGYALYGGNPVPAAGRNPMRPVVRLEAPVAQIRTVGAGARVGYNGRWTAPGPRRLATLSLGYADGFSRAASGIDATADSETGAALVAGRLCPIVGRISMDLTVLDVTEVPDARQGTVATLIGDGLDIDEVGRRAGTIGYEVLTALGRRYRRRCLRDGDVSGAS